VSVFQWWMARLQPVCRARRSARSSQAGRFDPDAQFSERAPSRPVRSQRVMRRVRFEADKILHHGGPEEREESVYYLWLCVPLIALVASICSRRLKGLATRRAATV